jgi:hypothetical protein
LLIQRVQVAERHRNGLDQGAEALPEFLAAVQGERAGGQAVECVLGVGDLRSLGELPGELDRCLDRLRARIAEEDAANAGVRPARELLGEQSGQQGTVHLHHVGQVQIDRLMQRGLDGRMTPAERVDAEPREVVQVPRAGIVPEIAAFGPDVVTVEAERPERPRELVIHVPLVQGEVLPRALRERSGYVERHAAPCRLIAASAGPEPPR